MSQHADLVIQSVTKYPERWKENSPRIFHESGKISVKIGSPFLDTRVDAKGITLPLSIRDKWKINKALSGFFQNGKKMLQATAMSFLVKELSK